MELRPALFPLVPPFVRFSNCAAEVEEAAKRGYKAMGVRGSEAHRHDPLCWHMWLPWVNPTVAATVSRAGYTVVMVCKREYGALEGGVWDFVDSNREDSDFGQLRHMVKINRLPGSHMLCRKDKLVLNYKWLQDRADVDDFHFLPESYALPEERAALYQAMKAEENLWIVKPSTLSCGKGIEIVSRTIDLPSKYSGNFFCVQRYIRNPLLINNTKFDLRLYVLLTSIDPIRLYLYEDGLVRFASETYEDNHESLKNPFIHLTNYAVNRSNKSDITGDGVPGSIKWTVGGLRRHLEASGISWTGIWAEIESLCVKTLLCGHFDMLVGVEELGPVSDYHCYKLFGLDVMLDTEMKPWLLEVNSYPSMFPTHTDLQVNGPLVAEMFNILGFHAPPLGRGADHDDNDENNTIFDRLYSRTKSQEQTEKEMEFSEGSLGPEDLLQHLTPHDLRILLRGEEELASAQTFARIFPKTDYIRLLDLLDLSVYSDRLMCAWELGKAAGLRTREELVDRCRQGDHLLP